MFFVTLSNAHQALLWETLLYRGQTTRRESEIGRGVWQALISEYRTLLYFHSPWSFNLVVSLSTQGRPYIPWPVVIGKWSVGWQEKSMCYYYICTCCQYSFTTQLRFQELFNFVVRRCGTSDSVEMRPKGNIKLKRRILIQDIVPKSHSSPPFLHLFRLTDWSEERFPWFTYASLLISSL